MKILGPEEVQRMLQGEPSQRELRVEVMVLERVRPATRTEGSLPAAWGPFRELRKLVVVEAGIKVEHTTTDRGEGMNIHVAGTPEEFASTLRDVPQGLPS